MTFKTVFTVSFTTESTTTATTQPNLVLASLSTNQVTSFGQAATFTDTAPRSLSLVPSQDATVKDVHFLAETDKFDLPVVGPTAGADTEKIIAAIYAAPPALVARAQAIVGR